MDIATIAKKIRQAVMDRAENDGRVFHADAIEDEVTKILKAETAMPVYNFYPSAMVARPGLMPGAINIVDDMTQTEWR